MMMLTQRLHPHPITVGILIAASTTIPCKSSLILLSDLPTPSFIIDTQALLRRHVVSMAAAAGPSADDTASPLFRSILPSIRCPKNGILLHPSLMSGGGVSPSTKSYPTISDAAECTTIECDFDVIEGSPSVGYIHSSVVRAREDVILGVDDPISTFLAELDIDCCLCSGNDNPNGSDGGARLVLGLNNHHVGSYYWARSAGAGSSMEAPGISFGRSNAGSVGAVGSSRGILRWINEEGPEACNSNDGKRSEWVNFLRTGDTVQLVPTDGQSTIMRFIERYGKSQSSYFDSNDDDGTIVDDNDASVERRRSIRVFGISSQGRPMGSEPEVICEWTLSD